MNQYQFDTACQNLARFMHEQAARVTRLIGISYRDADECEVPSNGVMIRMKFDHCIKTCTAFPISREGNESAVYGAAANLAFRFWHDYLHYAHRLGVGLRDELKLAAMHRDAVAKRFGADSLEARIMYADVAGQALYFANRGEFIKDQRAFDMSLARLGFCQRDAEIMAFPL
jgi:hypothetical protein